MSPCCRRPLLVTALLALTVGEADGALRPGRDGLPGQPARPGIGRPVSASPRLRWPESTLRTRPDRSLPSPRGTVPPPPAAARQPQPEETPPAPLPPEEEPRAPATKEEDPGEPIPTIVLPPLDLSRSDPDFLPGPAVIEVPPLILVLPPLPRRPTPRASEPTEPPSGLPLGTPPDLPDRLAAAPAHCPVNWLELYQDWALGADTAEDAAEARVLPFPAHLVGGRAALLVRVVDRYTGDVQSCRFDQETLTIGRNPESEVVLPGLTVSRRHARLVCRRGRLVLLDLGSTNGTWINGERIGRPELLGAEDVVTIGDYALSAEVTPPDAD